MKLNSLALANAATVVLLVVYVFCRILSLLAPDFLLSLGQSWFHTIDLGVVGTTASLNLGEFLLGAVSLGIITWVITYATAFVYNRFLK